MSNIYLISSYWGKLTFPKLRFSKFKKFISKSVFGEPQLTQVSLNFKTSCCNLQIIGLRKNNVRLFSICFVSKIFHFKQNCTPFFVKRRYWLWLTIENEFLHSRLWLLQGYVYPTLKKILITESGAWQSSNWANLWQICLGETT